MNKQIFTQTTGFTRSKDCQKIRTLVICLLGVLLSAATIVHADTPPAWTRGSAETTYQVWNFSTTNYPATNFPADGPVSNPYGTPTANIVKSAAGTGWRNTNTAQLGAVQGYWDIAKGSITLSVPVAQSIRPQTNQIQITYYVGFNDAPTLSISNATQIGSTTTIQGTPGGSLGGSWYTNLSTWVIQPGTSIETIKIVGHPTKGTLVDQIIVDTKQLPLPVAAPVTIYRTPGYTSKILLANIATNWTNPAGYTVSLAGVNPSTNGVQLSYDSTFIFYPSTNGVPDQFTYTITDGQGGSNTGIVQLALQTPSTAQTPNILGLTVNGDSTVTMQFVGIPNYIYKVQATTNLAPASWQLIGSGQAGTNGLWTFTDTNASLYPMRYYRTQYP